jgi:hypothetical protein
MTIMHACMHEKDVNLSNWCKLNRVGFNIVLTMSSVGKWYQI